MIKIIHNSIFYPDYIVESVLQISMAKLKSAGITHIVFDIDKTLVPKRASRLTPEYTAFLSALTSYGFTILIGSNTRRDISVIARQADAAVIRPSRLSYKPSKAFYRKVIAAAGAAPGHIVMVGDHIVNDIFGANRAGLKTILVNDRAAAGLRRLYIRRALRHRQ